jgi:hypothetical protein
MKVHKWAKEIKAWADGAEIEIRVNTETLGCDWTAIKQDYDWTPTEGVEYRIKPQPKEPQPKEPQYLYVYVDKTTDNPFFELEEPSSILEDADCKYIGKIKLEDESE